MRRSSGLVFCPGKEHLHDEREADMELTRRRFLTWVGLAGLGGLNLNVMGCGGKGLTGGLLHAPAQGTASPLHRSAEFRFRNDLRAVARAHPGADTPVRLITLAQLSDVHITLDDFNLTGYPQLEQMLDGFGDAIGFGGLNRPRTMERFDVDVLRAVVKTLNASADQLDLVINTGDSLDIATMSELIAFLSEMNNLYVPWFQTIGNHDRLGLGNIPPALLEAFTDLDFIDRSSFIEKHFPGEDHAAGVVTYGSRAKGFDFSPGFEGNPQSSQGFYAFTAVPPIHGGPNGIVQPGIRFYVLDTSRKAGSAVGRVGEQQRRWLSSELERHHTYLAIVVSHHPIRFISEGREKLTRLLHNHPQVIALLCGHEHMHRIEGIAQTGSPENGFWQIQTSSLIDYPQQARILEFFDNGNGTGTIRSYVFNQQATGELGKNAQASLKSAAGERFDGSGAEQDRNVELLFQMPSLG